MRPGGGTRTQRTRVERNRGPQDGAASPSTSSAQVDGEVGRQQLEEDEDPDSNEDEEATPMMSGVGRKEQNNRRSVVRCAGKGE